MITFLLLLVGPKDVVLFEIPYNKEGSVFPKIFNFVGMFSKFFDI